MKIFLILLEFSDGSLFIPIKSLAHFITWSKGREACEKRGLRVDKQWKFMSRSDGYVGL